MRALAIAFAASLLVGLITIPRVAEAAPSGSYRDSCRNFQVDGEILSADCQSGYGWRRSSINYKRCYSDISNQGGYLVCRGSGGFRPPYGRPDYDNNDNDNDGDYDNGYDRGDNGYDRGGDYDRGGGWRQGGLVLFGGYGYRGQAFPTSGDVSNLGGTNFNDRAQSVRINSGVWQLCENANFGGRCVTLSRSEPDLARLGLNGAVSSVRRLR
jgi:hypothetical protein